MTKLTCEAQRLSQAAMADKRSDGGACCQCALLAHLSREDAELYRNWRREGNLAAPGRRNQTYRPYENRAAEMRQDCLTLQHLRDAEEAGLVFDGGITAWRGCVEPHHNLQECHVPKDLRWVGRGICQADSIVLTVREIFERNAESVIVRGLVFRVPDFLRFWTDTKRFVALKRGLWAGTTNLGRNGRLVLQNGDLRMKVLSWLDPSMGVALLFCDAISGLSLWEQDEEMKERLEATGQFYPMRALYGWSSDGPGEMMRYMTVDDASRSRFERKSLCLSPDFRHPLQCLGQDSLFAELNRDHEAGEWAELGRQKDVVLNGLFEAGRKGLLALCDFSKIIRAEIKRCEKSAARLQMNRSKLASDLGS